MRSHGHLLLRGGQHAECGVGGAVARIASTSSRRQAAGPDASTVRLRQAEQVTSRPTCVVRPARADDLEAVLGVHAQHAGLGTSRTATGLEQETWDRMMATRDLTVFLVELDGDVVGTASAIVMPNITYGCAPTAFVEAVVVVPARRRQGVATAMMQAVLAAARAAGCNKVQLLSHKRHATDGAHHLYAALGFEPEAEGFRLYLQERPATAEAAGSL